MLLRKVCHCLMFASCVWMMTGCGGGGGGSTETPTATSTSTSTTTTTTNNQTQTVSTVNTTGTTSIISATVTYDNAALPAPPTVTFEAASSSSTPVLTSSSTFDIKTADTLVKISSSQQPSKPVTIELTYKDDNNDGVVDGTGIGLEDILAFYYDKTQNAWISVSSHGGQIIDTTQKKIFLTTTHFDGWIVATVPKAISTQKAKSTPAILKYYVDPTNTMSKAIENAVETWDKIIENIDFQSTTNIQDVIYLFTWESLPKGVVGQTNWEWNLDLAKPRICKIRFNSNENFTTLLKQGGEMVGGSYDLQTIALHEFGHAIGIWNHIDAEIYNPLPVIGCYPNKKLSEDSCCAGKCEGILTMPPIMKPLVGGYVQRALWQRDVEELKKVQQTWTIMPENEAIVTSFPVSISLKQHEQLQVPGPTNVANISGGIRPYAWTINGSLPANLSLQNMSTTGQQKEDEVGYLAEIVDFINGEAIELGTKDVTLAITDAYGTPSQPQTISIKVTCSDGTIPSTGTCVSISSVTADPSKVSSGATSTITCSANNPSGSALTYSWSKTDGTLTSSGNTAIWTAPNSTDSFTITCTVTDANGVSISKDTTITVTDKATVEVTW